MFPNTLANEIIVTAFGGIAWIKLVRTMAHKPPTDVLAWVNVTCGFAAAMLTLYQWVLWYPPHFRP